MLMRAEHLVQRAEDRSRRSSCSFRRQQLLRHVVDNAESIVRQAEEAAHLAVCRQAELTLEDTAPLERAEQLVRRASDGAAKASCHTLERPRRELQIPDWFHKQREAEQRIDEVLGCRALLPPHALRHILVIKTIS